MRALDGSGGAGGKETGIIYADRSRLLEHETYIRRQWAVAGTARLVGRGQASLIPVCLYCSDVQRCQLRDRWTILIWATPDHMGQHSMNPWGST